MDTPPFPRTMILYTEPHRKYSYLKNGVILFAHPQEVVNA